MTGQQAALPDDNDVPVDAEAEADAAAAPAEHGPETVKPALSERGERVVAWCFCGLAAFCLIFSYPLGFIWPAQKPMLFEFVLPTPQIMALAAIAVIVAGRGRPRWWLGVPLLVFGASLLVNLLLNPEHPMASLELSAYVLVPWAVAQLRWQGSLPKMEHIGSFFLLVWGYQVLQAVLAVAQGHQSVGLAGNINWEACFMMVLTPLAWYGMRYLLAKRPLHLLGGALILIWSVIVVTAVFQNSGPFGSVESRGGVVLACLVWAAVTLFFVMGIGSVIKETEIEMRQPMADVVALVIVGFGIGFVLWNCQSRAAWLALVSLCFLIILWSLGWLNRVLFSVFCVLLVIVGLVVFSRVAPAPSQGKLLDRFTQVVRKDVRLPLWGRTAALMADNDKVAGFVSQAMGREQDSAMLLVPEARRQNPRPLGIGAGNFQRDFAPYRATSRYHERAYAADTTIHPHNELLNVAVQLGLAAGLAWGVLMLLALRPPRGLVDWLVACAAYTGLVCAMLDMPMVRGPASLGIWLMVGWRLADGIRALPDGFSTDQLVKFRTMAASLAVLLMAVGALAMTNRELAFDGLYRAGRIAGAKRQPARAVQYYQEALAIKPDDMLVRYHMAQTMVHDLADEDALPELQRLQEQDPNYIHINRLLYLSYMQTGDVKQALIHAQREVDLYPSSPPALHDYYFILVLSGFYPLAEDVAKRHDILVASTIARDNTLDEVQRVLEHAMDNDYARENPEKLLAEVNRLFDFRGYNRTLRWEDPVFIDQSLDRPWTVELRSAHFRLDDISYWRLCGDLQKQLPEPSGDSLADMEVALRNLEKRLTYYPDQPDFTLPMQMMDGEPGNAWSFYAVASIAAYLRNVLAMVQVDADGDAERLILQHEEDLLIYDCDDGSIQRLSFAEWLQQQVPLQRLKIYFPYAMNQLRNQMMARMVALTLGQEDRLPNMIPSQALAAMVELNTGRHPRFEELAAMYAEVELNRLDAVMKEPE